MQIEYNGLYGELCAYFYYHYTYLDHIIWYQLETLPQKVSNWGIYPINIIMKFQHQSRNFIKNVSFLNQYFS